MALSISKLQKLLAARGFLLRKYFVYQGLCVYIETMSINTTDSFLLYIPSRYKLIIPRGDNVFKIKFIDLGDNNEHSTSEDYTNFPDNSELEKKYQEINILLKSTEEQNDIIPKLEEKYQRAITLKDLNKEGNLDIKDIFKQVYRLRFCVQSIQYKLAISYKNYLCVLNRHNIIECMSIKHYPSCNYKRMIICIDLELLYDNIDGIEKDIRIVQEGIYKVLDKNQAIHTQSIQRLLNIKRDITTISDQILTKKIRLIRYLSQFEELLTQTCNSGKNILNKINQVEKHYNGSNFYTDVDQSHRLGALEKELETVNNAKENIVINILDVRENRDHITLQVDKIMFDNVVMLDTIFKNFTLLSELIQK